MLLAALLAIATQVPAGEGYSALGTEPFWSVSIENGRMTYESLNGPNFSVAAPAPTQIYNGRAFAADRLILSLTHASAATA